MMDGADAVDRLNVGAVQRRAAALLLLSGACAATAAAGWHSPVRTTLAVVFLMLVPGAALAELFGLTEPLEMFMVAVGASIALGTAVSLALLYAHAWTLGLATGILIGLTLAALLVAVVRARRRERRPSGADRRG